MRTLTAWSLAVALAAAPAFGSEHVVGVQAAQERLREAGAVRERDRALVRHALSSPQARAAADAVGADLEKVRAAVGTLSDAELAEVAARAAALQSDPVAALASDVNTLLTIFLIVAIVILVLKAVD